LLHEEALNIPRSMEYTGVKTTSLKFCRRLINFPGYATVNSGRLPLAKILGVLLL